MATRRSARTASKQAPRIALALAGGGRNVQPAAPASQSAIHGGTDRSPAHFKSASTKPRPAYPRIGLALDRVRDPGLSLMRSGARPKLRRGTAAARAAAALSDCLDHLDRWLKVATLKSA